MKDLAMRVKTGVASGIFFLGAYLLSSYLFSSLLVISAIIVLVFEWPPLAKNNRWLWLLFPLYPLFPVLCLIYLNHAYRGLDILLPLYPFIVSWVADTGGYIAGNLYGKHKIAPRISPKKSWEGLAGSFLAVFLVNKLLIWTSPSFRLFGLSDRWFALISYSCLLTIVAFAGDLFESFLKRRAGVKDSGILLPGHGGVLDRADSVFFVAVLVVFYTVVF